jgi:hypothetical protein
VGVTGAPPRIAHAAVKYTPRPSAKRKALLKGSRHSRTSPQEVRGAAVTGAPDRLGAGVDAGRGVAAAEAAPTLEGVADMGVAPPPTSVQAVTLAGVGAADGVWAVYC